MNTGIISSFIIGGLLILAILFMNLNTTSSSASLTMRKITQLNVKDISDILSNDLLKIGYDQYQKISEPIIFADSNKIAFKCNLDNSGEIETVKWTFNRDIPIKSSPNPNDYLLLREVDGDKTEITTGVTSFDITYMDKNLNVIIPPISTQSQLNNIRHIKIQITVASKEKQGEVTGKKTDYTKSTITRMFTPKNIK